MAAASTTTPREITTNDSTWTSGEQLVLLAIFVGALVLRLLHLFEIRANDPFFTIPAVDGQLYHAQARALLSGGTGEMGGMGDGVLILGPFYPWFMAGVYALVGESLAALKLLQAALGAVDCLLVAWLASLYFDRATALVSAAITAAYGMLVFYGGTVMIVNVMVPLALLSAILVTLALRDRAWQRFLAAGFVVGCAALARQTMLLYALVVAAWVFYYARQGPKGSPGEETTGESEGGGAGDSFSHRAMLAAVFALGVALLILPFTARNVVRGDDLVLLNSTGGMNLFMGNNERASGAWVPPSFGLRVDSPLAMRAAFKLVAERATGRAMKPSEVSSYWAARGGQYILDHPLDWLALELRKLLLFWNAREVWNNRSIDISREFSWVLRLPLLGFGALAPFALLGMAWSIARWRELFPLYAMVAVHLGAGLVFFVLSRYRIPVVPFLAIFAAAAAARIIALARAKEWKPLGLAAGWLVVLVVITNRGMGSEDLYMAHFNVGNKYRDLHRYERAIESYTKSLASNKSFVATHNNLALAYEGAGQREAAIERWRHVRAWSIENGDSNRQGRAERHLNDLGAAPQ